jgi:hypothetical protein
LDGSVFKLVDKGAVSIAACRFSASLLKSSLNLNIILGASGGAMFEER